MRERNTVVVNFETGSVSQHLFLIDLHSTAAAAAAAAAKVSKSFRKTIDFLMTRFLFFFAPEYEFNEKNEFNEKTKFELCISFPRSQN